MYREAKILEFVKHFNKIFCSVNLLLQSNNSTEA